MGSWVSYPGLYQQTWYRTADDHLAIVGDSTSLSSLFLRSSRTRADWSLGTAQCMDVRRNPDPNVLGNVQTWQCIGGNTQQVSSGGYGL